MSDAARWSYDEPSDVHGTKEGIPIAYILDEGDEEPAPTASFASTCFNLAAGIIGPGALSLPFAFRCTGIFWGTVIMGFFFHSTMVTMHFLLKCANPSRHSFLLPTASDLDGSGSQEIVMTSNLLLQPPARSYDELVERISGRSLALVAKVTRHLCICKCSA